MKKMLLALGLIGVLALAAGSSVAAPPVNMLANPGFESGLTGWGAFGNVFAEAINPPAIDPLSGSMLAKMYGGFWGSFNVSGIFQEFPTTAGETYEMHSYARHYSQDAMTADGIDDNWVVQKIAWFDAGNTEIGGVESRILDGTYATDTWHSSATIVGTAPAGAVKLQALILFLQPLWDGGAAQIDDVSLVHVIPIKTEPTTWGKVKSLYR